MSRTTTVLLVVVVLLAAVVGLGWLLRSDSPAGAVGAPQDPADRPETSDDPAPLSGVPGEKRSSLATTTEQPTAVAAEQEPEEAPPSVATQTTPEPQPGVLVALRTPDGKPFPTRSILLFVPRAGASRTHPGETWGERDATGEYDICGQMTHEGADRERGVLGTVVLRCARPVWISLLHGNRVLDAQVAVAGQDEVVFVLDPVEVEAGLCSLRFRGVDEVTGEPLSQVAASVFSGGAFATFPSDEGARFALERLRPGALKLTLSGAERESVTREMTLEPGSAVDLGDIPLPAARRERLQVLVRRPDGTRDVVVHALPTEWLTKPGGPLMVSVWKKEIDEGDDEATIRLSPGSWGVWAEGLAEEGALRSATVLIELAGGGGQATLDLLRPVRVVLRNGPERAAALPRTLDGLWAQEPAYLAPDAEETLELVPGTYDLVVRVEGKDERVLPLQVGAQENVIDLR